MVLEFILTLWIALLLFDMINNRRLLGTAIMTRYFPGSSQHTTLIKVIPPPGRHVLIIDGECVMCNATATAVFQRNFPKATLEEEKRAILYATQSSGAGKEIMDALPQLKGVDSVVFVEHFSKGNGASGEVLVTAKSRAPLRVLMYCEPIYCRFLGYFCYYLIPAFVRDVVYDFIGRNRYKWFGKKEDLKCTRKGKGFTSRMFLGNQ